ncbi:MAG: cation-translocating P-type ATPase [Bacillota bacterium]|nr:cation-translocating P-type ATPase [Bacillota bacterium]
MADSPRALEKHRHEHRHGAGHEHSHGAGCGCTGGHDCSESAATDGGTVAAPASREGAGGGGLRRRLTVTGLDCADCALNLERALGAVPGVLHAQVSFATAQAVVVLATPDAERAVKIKARELGSVLSSPEAPERPVATRLGLTVAAAAIATVGWFLSRSAPAAGAWLYGAAVLAGGLSTFRAAAGALKSRMLTVDILVTLAVAAAMVTGEGLAAAEVVVLMSIGELLEERTMARTRRSVQGLLDLAPNTAIVRRAGQEIEVARDDLAAGDLVVVRPGGRIAVDGTVVEGRADVSEAPITGESRLRSKQPGDPVFAGSLAEDGALVIESGHVGPDTTLARMAALIEEAQMRRAPVARQVDRFAGLFIPFTLVAAALVGVVTGEVSRSVTILIGACPCALVLATPVSVFAGIGAASRRGILIKGGLYLERLGSLSLMALDKTGTLTRGDLEVAGVFAAADEGGGEDVHRHGPGAAETDCLVLAAAVERNSEHPIGRAVVRAAERRGLAVPEADGFQALPGAGVRALVDGGEVRVGSQRWLAECGVDLPPDHAATGEGLVSEGYSVVHVAADTRICGLIALSDTLRSDAPSAVRRLHHIGVRTVLLSGDAPAAAARVAAAVGIADYRGGLLPADKVRAIESLASGGRSVAMVGDGINDAPALSAATVGVAIGRTGSDLAIEASDVVLLADDLHRLAEMVLIGRRALANIRVNLAISAVAIAGLFLAAAFGWVGPAVGAIVHEGSALLVTANAMRMLGYRAQERHVAAAEERPHEANAWAGQGDGV